MIVSGESATEVMRNSISYTVKHGKKTNVWGGTISSDINNPDSPNDFDREMIELPDPITITLNNPYRNWTDYSKNSVGISLREHEDHLQGYNPGHVIDHSKLYKRWLIENEYFNYTYGERLRHFPYKVDSPGAKKNKIHSEFDQIQKVIELLKKHPTSRKICISSWSQIHDLGNDYCPCNVFFQIRVEDKKLVWKTVVRSLDVLRGLSENLFTFTLWQQYISSKTNIPCGAYKTVVLNCHLYSDMIRDGYHKQNIVDPYDHYIGQNAFSEDFPYETMSSIDSQLYNNKEPKNILSQCLNLPHYWRNWKLAICSDWYRKQNKLRAALLFYSLIDNEFAFPVARYLKKQHPDIVETLPFDKQREFLSRYD